MSYPFWLPESPRWLIQKGKFQEAIKAFRYIGDFNGVEIDVKLISEKLQPLIKSVEAEAKKDDENSNFLAITKYPRVLARFLILCLVQ